MSNFDVSYFVDIKNRFSAPAKKIADSGNRIKRVMHELKEKLPRTGKEFKQLAKDAKELGKKLTDVGKGLAMKVTAPLLLFGGVALAQSAKLETLSVSFDTMLGSAEKSKQLMESLLSFTATTPFQLQGVAQSAKQLLAFGVTQKEMIPRLRMLGDISAGAGVPLNDMAQIFGKAKSMGKLMTEQILQMAERGIPVVKVLAKGFGVTEQKVFDMASKSQISFDVMKQALGSMTKKGGIFFGQTEAQSKTLSGRWSTLKDNFLISAAAIGDVVVESTGLNSILQGMAEALVPLAGKIKEFAKNHPMITKIIIAFAGFLVVLGPVIIILGQLAFALSSIALIAPAIGAGFLTIGGGVAFLTMGFGSMAIAVLAATWPLLAIGAGIFLVYKAATILGELFEKAFPKSAAAMTNAIQDTFGNLFGFIEDSKSRLSNFISEFDISKVFANMSMAFTEVIQDNFGNLFGFIQDSIKRFQDLANKIRGKVDDKVSSSVGAVDRDIANSINSQMQTSMATVNQQISGSPTNFDNFDSVISPVNKSQTDINMNVRAPEGVVESIKTRTTGTGANVGTNMVEQ
jgi:tape measure domain-containing protein